LYVLVLGIIVDNSFFIELPVNRTHKFFERFLDQLDILVMILADRNLKSNRSVNILINPSIFIYLVSRWLISQNVGFFQAIKLRIEQTSIQNDHIFVGGLDKLVSKEKDSEEFNCFVKYDFTTPISFQLLFAHFDQYALLTRIASINDTSFTSYYTTIDDLSLTNQIANLSFDSSTLYILSRICSSVDYFFIENPLIPSANELVLDCDFDTFQMILLQFLVSNQFLNINAELETNVIINLVHICHDSNQTDTLYVFDIFLFETIVG